MSAVVVTGAAGMLGRVVVAELEAGGRRVVRLLRREDELATGEMTQPTVLGDATDISVVSQACEIAHRLAGGGDIGVVHLAAMPSPGVRPQDRVFPNNTAATYAVLEAAGRAGLRRAVIASSISALGFAFGRADLRPEFVPVDETHPTYAEDAYALSKVTDEATAHMMQRRWGMDVIALRLPFVGHGQRLDRRLAEAAADPGALRGDLWGWLHTADAARAFRLALEASTSGAHVVTVAAPDTVSEIPTPELLARYLPEVPVRAPLEGFSTVLDCHRAASLLGFTAEHGWRTHDRSGVVPATTRS